ncbi:MAG: DUF2147 domain-containing protein [Hydrogenophaga sp.]|uniref:DUF2147 domain-containing protein n=1 Tax=Hydrogenophaga sp. TaxID=1904254 RepID=UPI001BC6553A|nr:DUF2147 domain-containing protein [Hydrogenophaga sp.]MBS3911713.1 DUF2147 domain-containing protein [Hydrogenophaga sp.]MDO9147936.1 DUF2147 domain-containing protein [Hydrogenophaga sp.]MDO9604293.1 DUF2147 domain-containing protein [Hydrogenophaga sp.]
MIKTSLAAVVLAVFATGAWAQNTPVGAWHSIDDKTKEVKSEIVITDNGGVLSGKVVKLLRKDARQDAVCDLCTDDRKDKPVLGMEIIRGARKAEGKDVWEGGKILDPENGKAYTLRLTPIEGGKKLEVRGSVFGIGRTQTWIRVTN